MYGDELYYDELDGDDDLYYDEVDGVQASSSSSSCSSSSSSEKDDLPPLAGAPGKDVEINVEISEKKNDIIEIPRAKDEDMLRHDNVHKKVDNDMETSDVGFSEHSVLAEEHGYQIEELGQFEIERSLDDVMVEGINKEQSVDFSAGFGSDSLDLTGHNAHLDEKEYSYMSETSGANQLDSQDYNQSSTHDLD